MICVIMVKKDVAGLNYFAFVTTCVAEKSYTLHKLNKSKMVTQNPVHQKIILK